MTKKEEAKTLRGVQLQLNNLMVGLSLPLKPDDHLRMTKKKLSIIISEIERFCIVQELT